jgi:hypothetical protein
MNLGALTGTASRVEKASQAFNEKMAIGQMMQNAHKQVCDLIRSCIRAG